MSADLFAEFEPFSKPTQRQSQQSQSSDKPGAGQPLQPTSSPTPFTPNQISFGAGAPLSQPNISQNNQWFSYQQPSSAVGWTASSNFNASHTSQPKVDEDDDDDAWGDFEVASPEPQPIAPAFPQLNTFGTKPNILPTGQNPALQRTRITRASTLDLLSNNLVDAPDSFTLGEESKKPSWPAAPPPAATACATASSSPSPSSSSSAGSGSGSPSRRRRDASSRRRGGGVAAAATTVGFPTMLCPVVVVWW